MLQMFPVGFLPADPGVEVHVRLSEPMGLCTEISGVNSGTAVGPSKGCGHQGVERYLFSF